MLPRAHACHILERFPPASMTRELQIHSISVVKKEHSVTENEDRAIRKRGGPK